MAGETHGYDLAMEIAPAALQDLLGTFLSDHDIPCALLQSYLALLPLGTPATALGSCYPFTVTVSFDQPAGVPPDSVDITITTGNATTGTTTRMVVGLDVDHSQPQFDIVRLNVTDKLHLASVQLRIAGTTTPLPGNAANVIRGRIPPMALLPVPVTRGSSDCTSLIAADARILDDPASVGVNALLILLTAGGGTPGDATAFTSPAIPAGSDGALMLAFAWICRCLSERLTSELSLPAGSLENCRLQQRVRIDEAREVDLTEFEITLDPPRSIAVHARVHKEGFCYEANGNVNAQITLGIGNGELQLVPNVEQPDVDIDIPWYCWLAAAIIAIVTGGLVGWLVDIVVGIVIGVVVGGILMFLLWLLNQVVAGTVAGVTDAIKQALNNSVPGIDVPLLNMDIVLDNVTIDDIALGFQVIPISTFPVRSEGEVRLLNGQAIDLDSGSIGPPALVGGDVLWAGSGGSRRLSTLCTARLARTGRSRFDDFSRYQLSGLAYTSPAAANYDEIAHRPWWSPVDQPTYAVFGVRTDERRFAAVQVVEIDDAGIRLRYRTYEERVPSVRINGDFGCQQIGIGPAIDTVEIEPEPAATTATTEPAPSPPQLTPRFTRIPVERVAANGQELEDRSTSVLERGRMRVPDLGSWIDRGTTIPRATSACFEAVTTELTAPTDYEWAINRHRLEGDAGTLDLDGATAEYTGASTDRLCVTLHPGKSTTVQFELEVTATDAATNIARATRCIQWTRNCTVRRPPSLRWPIFRQTYVERWGIRIARAADDTASQRLPLDA